MLQMLHGDRQERKSVRQILFLFLPSLRSDQNSSERCIIAMHASAGSFYVRDTVQTTYYYIFVYYSSLSGSLKITEGVSRFKALG